MFWERRGLPNFNNTKTTGGATNHEEEVKSLSQNDQVTSTANQSSVNSDETMTQQMTGDNFANLVINEVTDDEDKSEESQNKQYDENGVPYTLDDFFSMVKFENMPPNLPHLRSPDIIKLYSIKFENFVMKSKLKLDDIAQEIIDFCRTKETLQNRKLIEMRLRVDRERNKRIFQDSSKVNDANMKNELETIFVD